MSDERDQLKTESAELRKMLNQIVADNEYLRAENKVLRQKVQALLKRLFGSKSEKVDPNQLELLLHIAEDVIEDSTDDDNDPPPSPRKRKRRESKPRMPDHLPIERVMLDDPEEVKAEPEAYRCIGEEITEELDVIPQQYIKRQYVRRKYQRRNDRHAPPVMIPMIARPIEGGYASPGLLADIVVKKYVDHLPLCRQEKILRERFGIELSRKTMTDWVRIVADWLKPIYNHICEQLQQSGYLQIDETPVHFSLSEGIGIGRGYLWVYNDPTGDVLYEWHTSRSANCLKQMLHDFSGTIQCDGYSAYTSYTKNRKDIAVAACWAHARRKFHEALDESPAQATWFLNQIGLLYHIESGLRQHQAGPVLRQTVRCAESSMALDRIKKALRLKLKDHLPQSQMGKAIAYTLRLWDALNLYKNDGRLEIDNNGVENAIRPTALGKKNWLFIGHPEAGDRSAIIYTIIACCRRSGINPFDYIKDVLARLPSMTNQQVASVTPAAWAAAQTAAAA